MNSGLFHNVTLDVWGSLIRDNRGSKRSGDSLDLQCAINSEGGFS